jgi:hypothetical protein
MFLSVVPKSSLNFPKQNTKESPTIRRYLYTMNEMMFEIMIENRINRIDYKYMNDLITETEYREHMNILRDMEEEFYNRLSIENCSL